METPTPRRGVRVRRRSKSADPRAADARAADPQKAESRSEGSRVVRTRERPRAPHGASEASGDRREVGAGGVTIRFEDPDILVLDRGPSSSARELARHLGRREGAPSGSREGGGRRGAWPVGSAESGITGLVLLARSARARRSLERNPELHVEYLAAVEEREEGRSGRPKGGSEPGPHPRTTARSEEPQVVARCDVRRLLQFDRRRAHRDVRTWLERRGYRVLRDPERRERIYLHALRLEFAHPVSGKSMRFQSDPPPELLRAGGSSARLEPSKPRRAPASAASEPDSARPLREAARGGVSPSDLRRDVPRMDVREARDVRDQRRGGATDWDQVADWFDVLLEDKQHDHYRDVILPGVMRLLEVSPGDRILDVACGQGQLCRLLSRAGADAVGVEASPRLVARARERSAGSKRPLVFHEGDARALTALELGVFDGIACVMALSNIDPISPVIRACAESLEPRGAFVAVIAHPAFRIPRRSSWEWTDAAGGDVRQYRRIDAYLSTARVPIVANPGAVARGAPAIQTWTFHRPLEQYVTEFASAGLWIDRIEEWASRRESDSGPRAAEENRARREIPLFMALRARRLGD